MYVANNYYFFCHFLKAFRQDMRRSGAHAGLTSLLSVSQGRFCGIRPECIWQKSLTIRHVISFFENHCDCINEYLGFQLFFTLIPRILYDRSIQPKALCTPGFGVVSVVACFLVRSWGTMNKHVSNIHHWFLCLPCREYWIKNRVTCVNSFL